VKGIQFRYEMRFSYDMGDDPKRRDPKRSQGDDTMIKLLTTVALVALVASPALARTKHRAHRAQAQAPQSYQDQRQARRSFGSASNVYSIRGTYVGTDPDPTIRAQMANDPTQTGD
jgi:Tfp pilus assembly protein PilE